MSIITHNIAHFTKVFLHFAADASGAIANFAANLTQALFDACACC